MEGQPGELRAFIDVIKRQTDDNEIVKQCVADLHAQQLQSARNQFEARHEYIRQIAELNLADRRGILDYGLQTLKWSFLLNAGAIAVVAAYVAGKSGSPPSSGSISSAVPLLKALWPFAVGCVFVTLAGAAGYFNFCYSQASLPTPEMLHNFMAPQAKAWPTAPTSRFRDWTRYVAIVAAVLSVMFFLYGVFQVLRAL
jgi:hypothetical protein